MRVFSPTNEYTVLTRLRDGRRFTARDRTGRLCLIVFEKRPHEAKRLVPVLMEWQRIEEFSDFYEFFPYKGGIAAVFAFFGHAAPLNTALTDMPYPQRAEILRGIFALILREGLPREILRSVLNPENLYVLSRDKAELLYDFPYKDTAALLRTVKMICSQCSAPEIFLLISKLGTAAHCQPMELYETAGHAADRLAAFLPPPDSPKKPTPGEIIQRAAAVKTAAAGRAAAVIALAAILAGYIAVGSFFYKTVIKPPRVNNGIVSVGTVVIYDGP